MWPLPVRARAARQPARCACLCTKSKSICRGDVTISLKQNCARFPPLLFSRLAVHLRMLSVHLFSPFYSPSSPFWFFALTSFSVFPCVAVLLFPLLLPLLAFLTFWQLFAQDASKDFFTRFGSSSTCIAEVWLFDYILFLFRSPTALLEGIRVAKLCVCRS